MCVCVCGWGDSLLVFDYLRRWRELQTNFVKRGDNGTGKRVSSVNEAKECEREISWCR